MSKRRDASRYLDLLAGVEEEEEEEGEEEGDWEDLEEEDIEMFAPFESGHGAPPPRGNIDADAMSDALHALAERSKINAQAERRRRFGRHDQSPSGVQQIEGHSGDKDDEPSYVLQDQAALPGPDDVYMFSLQVKKGKESIVVFRLFTKTLELDLQIISIFSVLKSPGRIYIEARSADFISRLLTGMHFVYLSSLFIVPIVERVALLQAGKTLPLIKEGAYVKIRNGLYKDDIGQVISVSDGYDALTVKLKSREALPQELKRKRGKSTRHEAYLLPKEKAKEIEGGISFKSSANGFSFWNKQYSHDGHRLLTIRYDRVERSQFGDLKSFNALVSTESSFVANEYYKASVKKQFLFSTPTTQFPASGCETVKFVLPKFLHICDSVLITGGPSAGAIGRVVDLKWPHSALVDLGLAVDSGPRRSIFLETKLIFVTRRFHIGDRVEVKIGEQLGRIGVVAFVDGEMLTVVNPHQLLEFQVPAKFVDSYDPSEILVPQVEEVGPCIGSSVIVSRGKHGGKTGTVALIERRHVRVIEYETNIELILRKDNVKVSGEIPDGDPLALEELPVTLRSKKDHTSLNEARDSDDDTCVLDHSKGGFEGQVVYAWHGPSKGKIGTVLQSSGTFARVNFESAIQGESWSYVPKGCLVAKCSCVVAEGVKLPWSKEELAGIPLLFDRTFPDVVDIRSKTPPALAGEDFVTHELEYHDPNGEGMWLFDARVVQQRKTYNLVLKMAPRGNDEGREGRILADEGSLTHPIPKSTPANVLVKYKDHKHVEHIESLPVSSLQATSRLQNGGMLLIVKGERTGELVIHIKTDGLMARVQAEGTNRKSAFYIEKSKLCIAERMM